MYNIHIQLIIIIREFGENVEKKMNGIWRIIGIYCNVCFIPRIDKVDLWHGVG